MANFTLLGTDVFSESTTLSYFIPFGGDSNMDTNNSTNGTTDKPPMVPRVFKSPPLQAEDLVTLPLYTIIFLLSVLGNLLVIITLFQNKRMRTVTNVFLLNLSISDLLRTVFCMPFTIIPIMLKTFVFGPIICVMIRYLQGVSVNVSCFTLVAISLERYFAICRPLHSRKWQTLSHSYKTIAVCWIAAFILSLPIAVYTKYWTSPWGNAFCREQWLDPGWYKAYTILLDFVLVLLPITIMSVSYGKIAHTLWSGMKMDKQEMESQNGHCHMYKGGETQRQQSQHSVNYKDGFGRSIGPSEIEELNKSRKVTSTTKMRYDTRGIRQTNNEKSRAAKKRVVKMLFAVVLEFFICWTPLFFLQTWITVDRGHAKMHVPEILLTASFFMSYVSSCCNPITYCFMNKNFRNGFLSVFRCCRCRKVVRSRTEMPSYYHYSSARTGVSQISSYDKVKEDSDEL